MKSLDERPLWGLEGKHPWRNPVSTSWEKVFPCTQPYTHSHSLPKFLQPNRAASHPQPLSTHSIPVYQNKNKNKNSSRAEPCTLYKIVAILSTWAWQPTPQDSPIYISWRSEQKSCCVSVSWNPENHPFLHTCKRQAILVNDSRDLLPLSTWKTETRDWQITTFRLRAVTHPPPDFIGIYLI